MALVVGQTAPLFELSSTNGDKFNLSTLEEPIILYFYPKDFTPACTKEACSFRDNFKVFRELDIKILGISTDSMVSHQKFKEAYDLPFHLLSDPTGHVSKLYKAHIPLLNISKRVTYLLDKERKIVAVYSDLMGAERHIKKMIESVTSVK